MSSESDSLLERARELLRLSEELNSLNHQPGGYADALDDRVKECRKLIREIEKTQQKGSSEM